MRFLTDPQHLVASGRSFGGHAIFPDHVRLTCGRLSGGSRAVSLEEIGEEGREEVTAAEMERSIEFLLQHQTTPEGRIERTQVQLSETQVQIAELGRVVQMQAQSHSHLNQTLTRAVSALADARSKTEARVDHLAGAVERLVERLSP